MSSFCGISTMLTNMEINQGQFIHDLQPMEKCGKLMAEFTFL
jgi:hypothetical protein